MSSDQTAVLRSRIEARRRRIDALQAQLEALQEPAAPESRLSSAQNAYKTSLSAYETKRDNIARDIREAENDIETAEGQIGVESARQRSEKLRETTSQRSQAGTQSRADRSSALATQRETRIASAAAEKETRTDTQLAAQRSRAGQYSYGPDGVPYGIYDDDGKLRLLSDKEQTRAIKSIRAGAVQRTRVVPGEAQYPGQTPEPTTVKEAVTIDDDVADIYTGTGGSGGRGGSGGAGGGGPGRSARWPEEIQADQLKVEESQLDIQKKRRDLLGPATVALQNHIALIDQVEKMVASGQLKPEAATQYVAQSEQNYKAALNGTTVAAEQERVRDDRRAKQKLGSDLIQQRLSAGSSLAASLTSSAFGSDVMMPQGKTTLGYSPIAVAMETTNTLGGGPEVSEFARRMLMESGMEAPGAPALPFGASAPYLPPQRTMPQ